MTYYLKTSDLDHLTTLESALSDWIKGPQDLFFVSRNGDMVHTQQALLNLYSPMLAIVLSEVKDDCPVISVDESFDTISTLVDLLAHGKAANNNTNVMEKVTRVAADLGINIDNIVIERLANKKKVPSLERIPKTKKIPGPPGSVNKSNIVKHSASNGKKTVSATNKSSNEHNLEDNITTEQEKALKEKYKVEQNKKNKKITMTKAQVRVEKIEKVYVNDKNKSDSTDTTNIIIKKENVNEEQHVNIEESVNEGDKISIQPSAPFDGQQCTDCSKTFKAKWGLNVHLRNGCKSKLEYFSKFLRCNECGKSFGLKSSLTRHKKLHTGDLPFSCEECGKTFPRVDNLKAHAKSLHNIELSSLIKGKDIVSLEPKEDESGIIDEEDNLSEGVYESGLIGVNQSENYNDQVSAGSLDTEKENIVNQEEVDDEKDV